MKQSAFKGSLILFATALIWGMAFVAQRTAMESAGPFFFSSLRLFIGAITLALIVLVLSRLKTSDQQQRFRSAQTSKQMLISGAICGVIVFAAINLQQIGLISTPAYKSAFLTALYIVLVPVLGLFLRHKTHWNTWLSVGLSVFGLYFITKLDNLSLELGDAITMLATFFWALHILAIDHFVREKSFLWILKLCVIQYLCCAVLSTIAFVIFEGPGSTHTFMAADVNYIELIWQILPALLYVGVLSTAGAYTGQAIGQQMLKPAAASLIMCTEAVFGALGGVLILGEVLTVTEILGCALMLAAIVLSQVDFKSLRYT